MREKEPLVSILIPAYDAEKWIAESIQSALIQTWPNKEIIIVDDGSRDRTLEVAKKFESSIVKIISQENRGQSAAENRALKEAQGEFIQYLDADDILGLNKIEIQIARLKEAPDCISSCEWARFYKSIKDAIFIPEVVWKDMAPVDWIVESLENIPMMGGAIWLIPREISNRAGQWDERLNLINDFDYFIRVILASSGIKFCKNAELFYRSGGKSRLSASKSRKALESGYLSLELGINNVLVKENSVRVRHAGAAMFQRFIYGTYPLTPDLLKRAEVKVLSLGGCNIKPSGGPVFNFICLLFGWRIASLIRSFFYVFGYEQIAIGFRIQRVLRRLKYRRKIG